MKMVMSDKLYDVLRWVAQLLLPGLGTLWFALSSIWHLPYGEEILGTIVAIDAFLGFILGLSTANYRAEQANKKIEAQARLFK